MELNYGVVHSSYRHTKYSRIESSMFDKKIFTRKVLKNETFAFQLILQSYEEMLCSIGEFNNISWKGLINRVRVSLACSDPCVLQNVSINFVDYIKDDTNALVSDIISDKDSLMVEEGIGQLIWVKGKVPKIFNGDFKFNVNLYYTSGYDDEILIASIPCSINYIDYSLPNPSDGSFFLDLWQHPCSLARQYNVPIWSDEHFNIIENYIKELGAGGQKTITIVASDFPWAGQGCFNVANNPSNLFEHNIVSVIKDNDGNMKLNTLALDRYIDICFKHGIDREIDIFGLISNWDGKAFKSPVYPEYKDPFRVSYYDENTKTFKYIRSKEDLHIYIKLLLTHFVDKGYMDKVRIFCDEPNNPELFKESRSFIQSTMPNINLKFKCAVHDTKFLEPNDSGVTDSSVIIPIIGEEFDRFKKAKENILVKGDTMTWFVCCYPQIPNQFISSPLLESRIVGHITYMLGLSGFLRWNFCLYPRDVFNEPSYKFPRWIAGDMFFVYPGRNMKPMSSIRWENLKIGIEEYHLMKMAEDAGASKDTILDLIYRVTGQVDSMKGNSRNFEMGYSLDESVYEDVRLEIIKLIDNNKF